MSIKSESEIDQDLRRDMLAKAIEHAERHEPEEVTLKRAQKYYDWVRGEVSLGVPSLNSGWPDGTRTVRRLKGKTSEEQAREPLFAEPDYIDEAKE